MNQKAARKAGKHFVPVTRVSSFEVTLDLYLENVKNGDQRESFADEQSCSRGDHHVTSFRPINLAH